jgi:uncharacterized membrane protein YedE/YeeE
MTIVNFTPYSALIGGALIGLAAALFVLLAGRILGISGTFAGIIMPARGDLAWRVALLAGMLAAPPAYRALGGVPPPIEITGSPALLIAAGLLVGFGSRLGSGCTSGHGVCGLARLSPRSIVATATFLVAAVVTVFVMRRIVGG